MLCTQIKCHSRVITASADNIKSLLNNFDNICGIPTIELLKKYSFMLFLDVDNIKQLLVSFKRYEIPDEYVRRYIRIFTVDNDVFLERIEAIRRHPDLYLWYKHPRILQLVDQKIKACDRVGYLRLLQRIKWFRLQTVLTGKSNMEK